ncbi:hypothetical protein [Nonomuraea jabiensis]|uniref:Secreted protein n=1 Tax=Nonomuraea jabiensis TaxID=882448 RepID=A0A7W9GDG0_9ACTN|nr:hypothetical protein [Nonomuraea jabiensis]MBB5781789.1 hypothetical protein [Nonomuraea jabiensis]
MQKKALAAAMVAAAALTLVPAAPAAAAVTIEVRTTSTATVRESDSDFICPANEVLTGRAHYGDENGYTTYWCSRIFINDVQVSVVRIDIFGAHLQEPSFYTTPENYGLRGRRHDGDEHGWTEYYPAALFWQGKVVKLVDRRWSGQMKENDHSSRAWPNEIMTGRWHAGDENGDTTYQYARVSIDA